MMVEVFRLSNLRDEWSSSASRDAIATLHMPTNELPRKGDYLSIHLPNGDSIGSVVHHVIREYQSGALINAEIVVE